MGLDVYVGSLSRYYARDWETIMQRMGREQGMEVLVINPNQSAEEDQASPAEIHAAALGWQKGVRGALASHTKEPVDWNEDPAAEYFTDKPGWEGLWALRLWAAHDDCPTLPRPKSLTDTPEESKALQAIWAEKPKSRYPHVVRDVELWLPIAIPFTFKMENLAGAQIEIGSSSEFLKQIEELNARTWRASTADLEEWRQAGPAEDNDFEQMARFGISVFHELARQAVDHRIPMLLDY